MIDFFERSVERDPDRVALVCEGREFTYGDLEARANSLAHHLMRRGARPGRRVGIYIPRSLDMYVAVLASARPVVDRGGDPEAYVIYTSGSTGRPKGVLVPHSAITNFVDVVIQIYDVRPSDRIYQGLTIAFDFSLEELWPTWGVGATMIAGPVDGRQVGSGLADFLEENRVTFYHGVPTVLATVDRDLPLIRTLNLGGEACPQGLVERWGRPPPADPQHLRPHRMHVLVHVCRTRAGSPRHHRRPAAHLLRRPPR
nr:AMP-binding protein [Propioniciclava flava]